MAHLLPLDEEQIIELAKIQCTNEEIAAVMKCSADTIERRFAGVIKEARKAGRSSLRRYMWLNAKKGNSIMQIWLSKQLLGMREPKNDDNQEIANQIVKIIDFAKYKKDHNNKD